MAWAFCCGCGWCWLVGGVVGGGWVRRMGVCVCLHALVTYIHTHVCICINPHRLEDDDEEGQQVEEEGEHHDGLPPQAVGQVAEEGGGEELDAALQAVAHAVCLLWGFGGRGWRAVSG